VSDSFRIIIHFITSTWWRRALARSCISISRTWLMQERITNVDTLGFLTIVVIIIIFGVKPAV
jgi:hypothetical protein